jgi:hypothetical protein
VEAGGLVRRTRSWSGRYSDWDGGADWIITEGLGRPDLFARVGGGHLKAENSKSRIADIHRHSTPPAAGHMKRSLLLNPREIVRSAIEIRTSAWISSCLPAACGLSHEALALRSSILRAPGRRCAESLPPARREQHAGPRRPRERTHLRSI